MAWRNPKPQLAQAITGEWSRSRLVLLLAVAAVVTVALGAGLGWSVAVLLTDNEPGVDGTSSGSPRADALEGSPETSVDRLVGDALPGPLANEATGVITLPPATSIGPAGVPTGFPRTRAGALAQLVAVDRAALESLSVPRAQDVIGAWAAEGGPDAESWTVVAGLRVLLSAAEQPAAGTTTVALRADAAMGQFPEHSDPDDDEGTSGRVIASEQSEVVACVDLVLTLTITAAGSEQIAAADCQRMTWGGDRWVIGPGPEPTPTLSAWPGTQAAIDAGYQWLEVAP